MNSCTTGHRWMHWIIWSKQNMEEKEMLQVREHLFFLVKKSGVCYDYRRIIQVSQETQKRIEEKI